MNSNNNRLRIYYNIHKKCLSVLHKTKKGWRLKEHRTSIKLKNVEFIVYEAGRQRVLKTKRKNVHCYVEGEETGHIPTPTCRISYNPYKYKQFTDLQGNEYLHVNYCSIIGKVVMI